jgi:ankyrin repeat protein
MKNTSFLVMTKLWMAAVLILALMPGAGFAGDKAGLTEELSEAAFNGNTSLCRALLGQGADADAKDQEGYSALLRAASGHHYTTVALFLTSGADVNGKSKNGETALMYGVCGGDSKLLKLLLKRGADVNARDNEGATPLMWAVSKCDPHARSWKIEGEALAGNQNELSPKANDRVVRGLQASVMTWWRALKRLLLPSEPQEDVVRLLVENGAELNAKDKTGASALMKAIRSGSFAIARLLIAGGAQSNMTIAAALGDKESVGRFIGEGSDVNEKAHGGLTPLEAAILFRRVEVAILLVEKGADVHQTHGSVGVPLLMAAAVGQVDLAKLFIENGANPNAAGGGGTTPLIVAATQGYTGMVRLLIAKGSDINARDSRGITPLNMAICNRHVEVMRILLDNGADMGAKDKEGKTALALATALDRTDAVNLLKKYGAKQ